MKKLAVMLMLIGLWLQSALAISRTGNVTAYGNTVYGEATLAMGPNDMPGVGHRLTINARITSPTGRTTGWLQKVTYSNQTNTISIPLGLLEDYGAWRFEASYNVFCPIGQLSSTITQSWLFTFGKSTNCFFIIPGTQQVINTSSGKKWYALYQPAAGCSASCIVTTPYGALSPYTVGSAPSAYINFKYTWVFLTFVGQKYCLEAYETGRNACTRANCGDGNGF